MKKLIIVLYLLFFCVDAYALELLLKVGSQHASNLDPEHGKGWRDGAIIDIRPSGFHTGIMIRKHHCIIDLPGIDYWTLRGSTDWKSAKKSVMDMKKFMSKASGNGKYKWENGHNKSDVLGSRRDFFVDFQRLLNLGFITQAQYDSIYDKDNDHLPISFPDIQITGKFRNGWNHARLNEK